jgi:hypothetical protein
MNPVYIYFSISPNTPSNAYIANTVKGLLHLYMKNENENLANNFDLDKVVETLTASLQSDTLPLMPVESFPSLEKKWEAKIKKCIDCAVDLVKEVSPLMQDEVTVSYEHSYLQTDWKQFEKGTGVITKKSSMATIYFVFPNTIISADGKMNRTLPQFPLNHKDTPRSFNFSQKSHLQQAPFNSFIV